MKMFAPAAGGGSSPKAKSAGCTWKKG